MANAYQIKSVTKICQKILLASKKNNKLAGGAVVRKIGEALASLEKTYETLTPERLIDYCVCACFTTRDHPTTPAVLFGEKILNRYKTQDGWMRRYEDKWLQEIGVERDKLMALVVQPVEHPQARFIYMEAEESTKLRLLNREVGFRVCAISTLGWSPVSEACSQCNFVDKCKERTSKCYPELYRLRIEYANK